MSEKNLRAEKASDERIDDDQADSCGCTPGLSCYRHFERPQNDGDTEAETAIRHGALTRIPHTPEQGDLYVIDGSAYEVTTFGDCGSTVVFEPIARPTSEVIMPLNIVRGSDAARYVE